MATIKRLQIPLRLLGKYRKLNYLSDDRSPLIDLTEWINDRISDGDITVGGGGPTDTDGLPEGATNLYFTDTRARAAFSAGAGISISGGGVISATSTATIGGSIANTQVAVGNAANSISGSADLTFTGGVLGITGAIRPSANNTYNLGNSGNHWNDVYAVSYYVGANTGNQARIYSNGNNRINMGGNVAINNSTLHVGQGTNPGITFQTTADSFTGDVNISRISAGVLGVGNGTAGNTSGTMQASRFNGNWWTENGGMSVTGTAPAANALRAANFTFETVVGWSDSATRTIWSFSSTGQFMTGGTLNHLATGLNFAPGSGTAIFNVLHLAPTINQTGGANGITRGLYINPTLTAAADFRAIEIANGNSIFGSSSTPSARLHIVGSGNTSATTGLLVQNSTPTTTFLVRNDGSFSLGNSNAGASSLTVSTLEGLSITGGAVTLNASNTIILLQHAGTNVLRLGTNNSVAIAPGGIGSDGSAVSVLDLQSTSRGFLMPRMTTVQRDAITAVQGLEIFNTTVNKGEYYNGIAWSDSASVVAINTQTGTTYTLVAGDCAKLVTLDNAGAITLTVPTNASVAFPIGQQINLAQVGAGQVTVAGDGGVTVNATPGLKLRAQYSSATLIKVATDTWLLIGDLSA